MHARPSGIEHIGTGSPDDELEALDDDELDDDVGSPEEELDELEVEPLNGVAPLDEELSGVSVASPISSAMPLTITEQPVSKNATMNDTRRRVLTPFFSSPLRPPIYPQCTNANVACSRVEKRSTGNVAARR